MLRSKRLRLAVHFAFVLRIKIARGAGDLRLLTQKWRLRRIRGIHISRGAAGINDAAEAGGVCGAEKILGALEIHLPMTARVMNGIELPGQVQPGVDGVGLEQVAQLPPRFGEVKLQELRQASDRRGPRPDIEAQDEFAVGLRAQPLDEALGQIAAAACNGKPNSQVELPPDPWTGESAIRREEFRSDVPRPAGKTPGSRSSWSCRCNSGKHLRRRRKGLTRRGTGQIGW